MPPIPCTPPPLAMKNCEQCFQGWLKATETLLCTRHHPEHFTCFINPPPSHGTAHPRGEEIRAQRGRVTYPAQRQQGLEPGPQAWTLNHRTNHCLQAQVSAPPSTLLTPLPVVPSLGPELGRFPGEDWTLPLQTNGKNIPNTGLWVHVKLDTFRAHYSRVSS